MWKKTLLAIFGAIAALGIVFAIIGVAIGGRIGGYYYSDGDSIMYRTGQQSYRVADAPYWWGNWNNSWQFNWFSGAHQIDSHAEDFDDSQKWTPSANEASSIQGIDVFISAGYITIRQGDTPSLEVNGSAPYSSTLEDGLWEITTPHYSNTTTRKVQGDTRMHFFHNGEDITLDIILTVPTDLHSLDFSLGLGSLEATNLDIQKVSLDADIGTVDAESIISDSFTFTASVGNGSLSNINSTNISISTDVGNIDAYGINADTCELSASVGTINLQGDVTQTLTADVDVGSIYTTLKRPAQYSWDVDAEIASVTIDGHRKRGTGNTNQGKEGLSLILSAAVGSISVSFE